MESVYQIVTIRVNETSWAHVWRLRSRYLGTRYDKEQLLARERELNNREGAIITWEEGLIAFACTLGEVSHTYRYFIILLRRWKTCIIPPLSPCVPNRDELGFWGLG
jgi:hypothetical protein